MKRMIKPLNGIQGARQGGGQGVSRRHALKTLLTAGGAAALSSVAGPIPAFARMDVEAGHSQRVLILIELKGGNDALNMVIPYRDPLYTRLRPRLAIARDQVMPLSDTLALNPAMQALGEMWDQQQLAIMPGLGYAPPNRSHFRSIEIWDSASDADQTLQQGWLGSLTDAGQRHAVVLGKGDPGPLLNSGLHTLYMEDPDGFVRQARRQHLTQTPVPGSANPALRHLLDLRAELTTSASRLAARLPEQQAVGDFPKSPFGRSLRQAARLILAGAKGGQPQSVIKLSLGSFDTHARQRATQDRLLRQLAEGVAALRNSLLGLGLWDQTLLMTYSEFGRRARENGSGGTDHGTAAAHLMMGGRVRGGFYGEQPSLARLDQSDLVHTADFRRLYATVVQDWWGQTPQGVLAGQRSFRCIT